jgi:hypothetical protein
MRTSAADVDSYFMVGGSSRLLQIACMLQELFGRRPNRVSGRYGTMDPGLAVAQGAAMFDLHGYITEQSRAGLSIANLPVIPTIAHRLAYTVSVLGESNGTQTARAIIPKGTTLPSHRFELAAFLPKDSWTLDVELKKGEGNPKLCKDFHVRHITLETMRKRGDRIVIGLSIDGNGDIYLRRAHARSGQQGLTFIRRARPRRLRVRPNRPGGSRPEAGGHKPVPQRARRHRWEKVSDTRVALPPSRRTMSACCSTPRCQIDDGSPGARLLSVPMA